MHINKIVRIVTETIFYFVSRADVTVVYECVSSSAKVEPVTPVEKPDVYKKTVVQVIVETIMLYNESDEHAKYQPT